MTGRERLLKVLNEEAVDRVPVVPFIFNNFINEFYKTSDIDPIVKGIEVYKHFGFDIILRTCNIWTLGNESAYDSRNWRVFEEREDNGDEWTVTTTIRTPEKELKQQKRFSRATKYEVFEAVVEYFIKDESDFDQFVKYQPDVPEYDCSIIKKARDLLGEDGLAAPWAQGAFNSVSLYRKLDDLLIDPYNNPEFYEKLIRYFSERMLETIRQFVKAGADIICCGGNVGNATMVGPRFFKDFVLPYEIEFAKNIKELGVFYLYHNCGDAALLLEYYSQIKMNIYESLTAPPYGDTMLEDALEKLDRSIVLCGNIDQIDFLKKASEEEICQEVKRILERAKLRGNFILGTTDYFSEGTPHNNIHAFAKAGLEFGKY